MNLLSSPSLVITILNEAVSAAARRSKNPCIVNDNPEIIDFICRRNIDIIKDKMDECRQKKRRQLATLRALYTRALKHPEFESLRRHRNTVLAHTAIPRFERACTQSVRPAKWSDEKVALKATISISQYLSLVVRDHVPSLMDVAPIYRDYAKHFWAHPQKMKGDRKY